MSSLPSTSGGDTDDVFATAAADDNSLAVAVRDSMTVADPDYDPEAEARALASKTPISLLQELATKRGLVPQYELLTTEGQIHEPTFVYRVLLNEFTATGAGKSKKLAKHMAAKGILERMFRQQPEQWAIQGVEPQESFDFLQSLMPELNAGVVYPIGQNSEGDHVHIPAAGEPGEGKSKKLSKRIAADKMIAFLSAMPVDSNALTMNRDAIDTLSSDDVPSGCGLGGSTSGKFGELLALPVPESDPALTDEDPSANTGLGVLLSTDLDEEEGSEKHVTLLRRIANERGWEMPIFEPLKQKSTDNKYQCMVKLKSTPPMQSFGIASSSHFIARCEAAFNMLQLIKIMNTTF